MWCSTVGGIVALTLNLLTVPLADAAQPTGKVWRIGYLVAGSVSKVEMATPMALIYITQVATY